MNYIAIFNGYLKLPEVFFGGDVVGIQPINHNRFFGSTMTGDFNKQCETDDRLRPLYFIGFHSFAKIWGCGSPSLFYIQSISNGFS